LVIRLGYEVAGLRIEQARAIVLDLRERRHNQQKPQ